MTGQYGDWPVVDFPLYGLGPSWSGLRWFEFFEADRSHDGGWPANRIWCVWLGHRKPGAENYLLVRTMPRRRWDEVWNDGEPEASRSLAWAAGFTAINLSRPQLRADNDSREFWRRMVEHVDDEADRYLSWATTTWQLDGVKAQARFWRFADRWAGFAVADPDVYVVLHGSGMGPAGWDLRRLKDGALYDFDLQIPPSISALNEARQNRPEASVPETHQQEPHADQLPFLALSPLRSD